MTEFEEWAKRTRGGVRIHSDPFLVDLDGMIESTEEFIADDGLMADESRIHDLAALLRVRELWSTTFKPAMEGKPTLCRICDGKGLTTCGACTGEGYVQ